MGATQTFAPSVTVVKTPCPVALPLQKSRVPPNVMSSLYATICNKQSLRQGHKSAGTVNINGTIFGAFLYKCLPWVRLNAKPAQSLFSDDRAWQNCVCIACS